MTARYGYEETKTKNNGGKYKLTFSWMFTARQKNKC